MRNSKNSKLIYKEIFHRKKFKIDLFGGKRISKSILFEFQNLRWRKFLANNFLETKNYGLGILLSFALLDF